MRITRETLLALGAERKDGFDYLLISSDLHFTFRDNGAGTWMMATGKYPCSWHVVESVGELLGLAYQDGRDDGEDALQKGLRELLGVAA